MIFDAEDFSDHEEVVFVSDPTCGLKAVIAVHNTALGPGVGGCRVQPYASDAEAVRDVLRLSKGMTYKNAMAGLALGGGKAVVIANPRTDKTPAMMRGLGRAIDRLGGHYITGEDVGTSAEDMVEIRKGTAHVLGLPVSAGGSGDPSPSTALGCLVGIEACVSHVFGTRDLRGIRVAVLGLGHVGSNLCRLLSEAGAVLTVSDVRATHAAQCAERYRARAVAPEALLAADVDVLAPCALGAVLNEASIARLNARIVAGAANNQLATPADGTRLRERGILYAPDYVINAGGIIQLACERDRCDAATAERQVRAIHDTLLSVFACAEERGIPTSEAADRIAEDRLAAATAPMVARAAAG